MNPNHTPGFPVVGIGASAGGVSALKRLFANMPADTGMAFVIILHLSQEHESSLASILQTQTEMQVTQVTENVPVEPNRIYVIPPAKHLVMMDGIIELQEPERVRGKRVPIDLFFRTLGEAYGTNAIAIVLTGSGTDGTLGLKRVKEAGGIAIAQDPTEAEFDSMPRSAIGTDLVDICLPVADIPQKLLTLRNSSQSIQKALTEEEPPVDDFELAIREILTLLKVRTGHDFSCYKRPTILRRTARRLQVRGFERMDEYVAFLRSNAEEVEALVRDLLISVTNFFRDKEAFTALSEQIIPAIFEGKTSRDIVRAWVCACATGEEAYSVAILLHEYALTLQDPPRIQVFASDLDEAAIHKARDCRFDESIVVDVSRERLQRYFVKSGDTYIVAKELREIVLFAPHNVLRDPPFSRLDLVTCRNLLIYLNRTTQDRLMEIFHFALSRDGYLFLGSSETVDAQSTQFNPVDKKHRIYKTSGTKSYQGPPVVPTTSKWETRAGTPIGSDTDAALTAGVLHHKVVEQYAPPSVLVNGDYEIVHSSASMGRYLRFVGGEPSRNLLKVIDPALQLDLRASLVIAKQEHKRTESRHVRMGEGDSGVVNISVQPVELAQGPHNLLLVLFEEANPDEVTAESAIRSEDVHGNHALETVVHRLEDEILQLRERLRSTVEQSETSNEELKASNEELQAINEELRSATEELETSKEELQSLNEELTTVNHELKEKVDEVSRSHSDLQNLMHATDIGTLFLDRDLRIKRYTPRVQELFNVISSDVGRPFEHLTHRLDYTRLDEDAEEVLRTLVPLERQVRGGTHNGCYLARISPYRTLEDKIDGVVISFLDVTELKETTDILRDREYSLTLAQEAAKAGVWNLNLVTGVAWWSDECSRLHGVEPGSVEKTVENWINVLHPDNHEQVKKNLESASKETEKYSLEFRVVDPEGGDRWLLEAGRAVFDAEGRPVRAAGITLDVTDRVLWQETQAQALQMRKEAEDALLEADRRKNEFLATLAHELRNPLAPIRTGLEILRMVDDEEEREYAQGIVERQVRQIVRLVDDLMDISRITQGKIQLKLATVNLSEVIRSALETSKPSIEGAGQNLNISLCEEQLFVNGDSARLSQVLLNLLNNAAKFSSTSGEISLILRREGDFARISIQDSGEGISPELLPHVFDIFMQAPQTPHRTHGGMGIGLSLVRKLAELHGGKVAATSRGLGHGSEFSILLPLTGPPQQSEQEATKVAQETQGADIPQRILIVDDNQDAASTLKVLLAQDGHVVLVASDGLSAVEAAEGFRPEYVVLDIGLPDLDGYEVARIMRQKHPSANLIALSGWGQADDRRRSQEAGIDHHLVKPVDIQDLRRLLV